MNKIQLLQRAKRIVDERRLQAEDNCERLLQTLRNNAEYAEIERNLRQAEIDCVMQGGKAQKQAAEKVKEYQAKRKQLLATLGVKATDLKPHYRCAKCSDTGYVNGSACSCLQEEIRKLIVAESNVTNGDYTFENSKESSKHNLAVYKAAKKACIDGDKNILLVGNTGTGKTYLLTACANLCADLSKSVLLVTAYTLNGMLLDAHLSDSATNQAIMDSLVDVDVLAIDDLGTENVYKNVTAEYFFAVINERIARKKQTFVSTNLSLANIRERYDERMFSRLVDQKITVVAEMEGADKRIKKA